MRGRRLDSIRELTGKGRTKTPARHRLSSAAESAAGAACVSFHSKCKVLGKHSDTVQHFKGPCLRSFPWNFLGPHREGPSLCEKSSVSSGWDKKGPCSRPVLIRITGGPHEPAKNISSPFRREKGCNYDISQRRLLWRAYRAALRSL